MVIRSGQVLHHYRLVEKIGEGGMGEVYLAWVYTILGDYDSAFDQLEILLERPSRITMSFLKLDPRWEPL